jgi:hypothetical protein
MNKAQLLKVTNLVLFISAALQIVTVLALPLNINKRMFFEIHKYNGFLFIALIIIHLALNWSWVKATYLKRK